MDFFSINESQAELLALINIHDFSQTVTYVKFGGKHKIRQHFWKNTLLYKKKNRYTLFDYIASESEHLSIEYVLRIKNELRNMSDSGQFIFKINI